MDIDHFIAVFFGYCIKVVAYADGIYSVFHSRTKGGYEILKDYAFILGKAEILFRICKNVLFAVGLVCNGDKFLYLSVIDDLSETVENGYSLACEGDEFSVGIHSFKLTVEVSAVEASFCNYIEKVFDSCFEKEVIVKIDILVLFEKAVYLGFRVTYVAGEKFLGGDGVSGAEGFYGFYVCCVMAGLGVANGAVKVKYKKLFFIKYSLIHCQLKINNVVESNFSSGRRITDSASGELIASGAY